MTLESVETLAKHYGFKDYKWISGHDVVVKQWVRFSCKFKCPTYGDKPICPPNMPSIHECERFFKEYKHIMIIRFHKKAHHRNDDKAVFKSVDESLIDFEKKLFYQGYYKVMLLPATICARCETCAKIPDQCHHKALSRPTPEALGVDVFETVKKFGYPLEVLTDYNKTMNRYSFMLVV